MALTTLSHTKSVALTDYMPPFRQEEKQQSWGWEQFTTRKSTQRATEQVFSTSGLPPALQTDELEPIAYRDASELAATTFTMLKYTLATMFSDEFLADSWHLKDQLKDAGKSAGKSHSHVRDQVVAAVFNNAFATTNQTMYDSAALCDSHTMKSGDALDNDLTAASITFDNLWLMVDYFQGSMFAHSGLYLVDKPKWLVYHPSKDKQVRAILESTQEPATADNDKNTLKGMLTPVPCRFLTTSTYWFVLGEGFKDDLIFWDRAKVSTDVENDFDRMAKKFRSYQRFDVGARDFIRICGNPGA